MLRFATFLALRREDWLRSWNIYIFTYFQVCFEAIDEKEIHLFKKSVEIKIIKEVRNLSENILGRI